MVNQPKILWLLLALKLNCCMFLNPQQISLSFVMQNYYKTLIQFSNSKKYDSYKISVNSNLISYVYIKGPITIRILLQCYMQVIHQIWCQNIKNVKFQFIFLLGYAHKTSQLIKWCGTRAGLLRFCRPLIGTNSTPTQHKSLKFTRKKNITQRSFYHYEENNIISC